MFIAESLDNLKPLDNLSVLFMFTREFYYAHSLFFFVQSEIRLSGRLPVFPVFRTLI